MVHNIAKRTFFCYRLAWLFFSKAINFGGAGSNIVLVGVYHILAGDKEDQQYPCNDNMIFTLFQINY